MGKQNSAGRLRGWRMGEGDMKKLLGVVLVLALGALAWFMIGPGRDEPELPAPEPATVRLIQNGEIIGFEDRFGAYAWLGIPYGAPPVGELRWKAPRAHPGWSTRRETLGFGSPCPQIGGLLSETGRDTFGQAVGSEDCLFMNIWTPHFAPEDLPQPGDGLPVMLWIHGGGNTVGHGGSASYNGAHLATRHDLVVVSINYRLGPLGWFTHPVLRSSKATGEDNSGNYGTLDVIFALQWIQDNISRFGGDPGNVTIFGESAGARNVLTLMASPLANNLYHKAIVQSGGFGIGEVSWAENYSDDQLPGHAFSSREVINRLLVRDKLAADRAEAKAYQQKMDEPTLLAYLQGKSAGEILQVYEGLAGGMINVPQIFGDGLVLPAGESTSALFLDPAKYHDTPIILGTNRDETRLFSLMGSEAIKRFFGIPWSFSDEAAYLRDNSYGSDAWKVRGVDEIATNLVAGKQAANDQEAGSDSVFAYRFDWDEEKSVFGFDMSKALGAGHGMEIFFVFGNFDNNFGLDLYQADGIDARNQLSNSMMSYWAEFAYNGNPGTGRDGEQVPWTPWPDGGEPALGLLVLDTVRDRGIRMTTDRLTLAGIKTSFLSDTSYADQAAYCAAYRMIFRGDAFDQQEFATLGKDGCQTDE